jgi:hypothetical protein
LPSGWYLFVPPPASRRHILLIFDPRSRELLGILVETGKHPCRPRPVATPVASPDPRSASASGGEQYGRRRCSGEEEVSPKCRGRCWQGSLAGFAGRVRWQGSLAGFGWRVSFGGAFRVKTVAARPEPRWDFWKKLLPNDGKWRRSSIPLGTRVPLRPGAGLSAVRERVSTSR